MFVMIVLGVGGWQVVEQWGGGCWGGGGVGGGTLGLTLSPSIID